MIGFIELLGRNTQRTPRMSTQEQYIEDFLKRDTGIDYWSRTVEGIYVLFLYNIDPKSWRYNYLSTRGGRPEEGWIEFHPSGDIILTTLWNTKNKREGKYDKFLDILKPEANGYHECATAGKYQPSGTDQSKKAPTRWAKHIANKGTLIKIWRESLSHYLYAMKLG